MTEDETYSLMARLYNFLIRDFLPKKVSVHNGIATRSVRLFDATDHFPREKSEFIDPLVDEIQRDDTIVQIGGGAGLSTLAAAEAAGPNGKAITYEASEQQVTLINETVRLNSKTWRKKSDVHIRHGIVGEAVKVESELGDPDVVPPSELPECEVFALDCEGAELGIIKNIPLKPRAIVVETHGWLGSTTSDVRSVLEESGYTVIDEIPERQERDNYVLVARSESE